MKHEQNGPQQRNGRAVKDDGRRFFIKLPRLVAHRFPVYRHTAGADGRTQLLSGAAAGVRQNFIEPQHVCLLVSYSFRIGNRLYYQA